MESTTIHEHLSAISSEHAELRNIDDRAVNIASEDGWVGIALGTELSKESMRLLHDRLSSKLPSIILEIRAGDQIFRGGNGLGDGKHVLAILGGKGGVGKTTVAVNLALTLTAMGHSVGLLDGDLTAPDVPHMFGIHSAGDEQRRMLRLWHQEATPPSQRLRPHHKLGLELASVGLFVPERMSVELSGALHASSLLRFMVFDVGWSSDIVIVDAPPGTGQEVQTIIRSLPTSGVVLVTTPQDVAQMDTERTVDLLNDASIPVIGAVHNMAELPCPHCGENIDLFQTATRLVDSGISLLGRIPFDTGLSPAADQGKPLVLANPRGPVATEFANISLHVRRWIASLN